VKKSRGSDLEIEEEGGNILCGIDGFGFGRVAEVGVGSNIHVSRSFVCEMEETGFGSFALGFEGFESKCKASEVGTLDVDSYI